ncbi:MAG: RDD family protein [Planctomycetaceae bacterium]
MHYPGNNSWSADAGVQFETPENVLIQYPVAGAGTRFLSFLIDFLVTLVGKIVIAVVLLTIGAAAGVLDGFAAVFNDEQKPQFSQYFVGIAIIVWTFGTFAYSMICERFFRGQTLGKALLGLRVVKANGFSLDATSLLVRNIFRFIDHLPPLWLIPLLSARTQRGGDMAAGTIVVVDRVAPMSLVRRELAGREAVASRYRFDHAMLTRLRPVDVRFVEELLDRWDDLRPRRHRRLLLRTVPALCRRMKSELPPRSDTLRFLEDLIAAEYRRRGKSVI